MKPLRQPRVTHRIQAPPCITEILSKGSLAATSSLRFNASDSLSREESRLVFFPFLFLPRDVSLWREKSNGATGGGWLLMTDGAGGGDALLGKVLKGKKKKLTISFCNS